MKESLKLLGQIIEVAEANDLDFKKKHVKGKGSLTVGESWMVFHLKVLKKLLKEKND